MIELILLAISAIITYTLYIFARGGMQHYLDLSEEDENLSEIQEDVKTFKNIFLLILIVSLVCHGIIAYTLIPLIL